MTILSVISLLDEKIAKFKEVRDFLAAELMAEPTTNGTEAKAGNRTADSTATEAATGKAHPLKGRPLSPKAYKNVVNGIRRRQAAKATKDALESKPATSIKPERPKPRFSKAGLERLRLAAKQRWAEKKKLGLPGGRLPANVKAKLK